MLIKRVKNTCCQGKGQWYTDLFKVQQVVKDPVQSR